MTSKSEVESMFAALVRAMGVESGYEDGQYFLEWQGQRCRIARVCGTGISVPFLHTWFTKTQASDMFWFAARAIDLMKEANSG